MGTFDPSATYPCPMVCPAEAHPCWYALRGLEVAAGMRNWLSRPLYPGPMEDNVLEALFADHEQEETLQEVVATSLRRLRGSLETVGAIPVRGGDEVVHCPIAACVSGTMSLEPSIEPEPTITTDPTVASSGTPVTVRKRKRVEPLMEVVCRRPPLLGYFPGSVAWAHRYCQQLLNQR
jgi:hypothetical protein